MKWQKLAKQSKARKMTLVDKEVCKKAENIEDLLKWKTRSSHSGAITFDKTGQGISNDNWAKVRVRLTG